MIPRSTGGCTAKTAKQGIFFGDNCVFNRLWALGSNLSAKLEYLLSGCRGSPTSRPWNVGTAVGGAGIFQRLDQTLNDSSLDIVRVSLNCRFNGPIVVKY
jgi:hypothetical protein